MQNEKEIVNVRSLTLFTLYNRFLIRSSKSN